MACKMEKVGAMQITGVIFGNKPSNYSIISLGALLDLKHISKPF